MYLFNELCQRSVDNIEPTLMTSSNWECITLHFWGAPAGQPKASTVREGVDYGTSERDFIAYEGC
jgi:hypothetical protein